MESPTLCLGPLEVPGMLQNPVSDLRQRFLLFLIFFVTQLANPEPVAGFGFCDWPVLAILFLLVTLVAYQSLNLCRI